MYNTIIVHSGVFHADDAMCVALAKMLNPDIKVERANKVPDDVDETTTIVADIGYGRYDHHQQDAERRPDGQKHAACGLLFRDLSREIFPDEESAAGFNARYIIPVEDADNGVCPNPLSTAIRAMNPAWSEDSRDPKYFEAAVALCMNIIENDVRQAKARIKAADIVKPAVDLCACTNSRVLVLDQYAPWGKYVADKEDILFVVFPSNRGGWNVNAVALGESTFGNRKKLPDTWLHDRPEGCTFVHPGLFIASFDTKEAAITAAQAAVDF